MNKLLPCLFLLVYYTDAFAQKNCLQDAYQQAIITLHPSLPGKYRIIDSSFSARHIHFSPAKTDTLAIPGKTPQEVPAEIVIPVVVHILWNNAAQDISTAQVISQLAVLNQDFNSLNTDRGKVPWYFSGLVANCSIRFVLAKMDPQGQPTNGIVRIQTSQSVFGFDDKAKSHVFGGDDPWDASSYLNIWVCNLEQGISGYASVPGGPAEKDGVVISTSVFGTFNNNGPYNKGRTAVHEIGHWLNLLHTWGDANCGDDKVDDTPTQAGPNRGCNTGEKFSCGTTPHGDMYMNFMDFSDDGCMYMFTKGQNARMRALFETGGPRNSLLTSHGLDGNGVSQDVLPFSDPEILLYPVPASSFITLQLNTHNNNNTGKTIIIYNQLGQIVKTINCIARMQQLNISTLQPGLYFIKVEGAAAMKKFVKQ